MRDEVNKRLRMHREQEPRQPETTRNGDPGSVGDYLMKKLLDFTRAKDMEWTRTHGFCTIMRGLVVHERQGGVVVERLWTMDDLNTTNKELRKEMEHLTKDDLEDKSKADWMAKLFASLQISWFVIQQVARSLSEENLPRTQLGRGSPPGYSSRNVSIVRKHIRTLLQNPY